MSQLHASSKGNVNNKHLYYSIPKTNYERFINKKWTERKNIFESRSSFIARADKTWKESSDTQKEHFMNTIPPPTKSRINFFFKQNATVKSSTATSTTDNLKGTSTSTVTSNNSKAMPVNDPSTASSINANSATESREKFLTEKEFIMLKSFFAETIGVSYEEFFTTDIKNDHHFMQVLTAFIYKWDAFNNLREQYCGSQQRIKKSAIKNQISDIEQALSNFKKIISEICQINIHKVI